MAKNVLWHFMPFSLALQLLFCDGRCSLGTFVFSTNRADHHYINIFIILYKVDTCNLMLT